MSGRSNLTKNIACRISNDADKALKLKAKELGWKKGRLSRDIIEIVMSHWNEFLNLGLVSTDTEGTKTQSKPAVEANANLIPANQSSDLESVAMAQAKRISEWSQKGISMPVVPLGLRIEQRRWVLDYGYLREDELDKLSHIEQLKYYKETWEKVRLLMKPE